MRAQVTLTPTESKKLIAKGIAAMDLLKKARKHGMVVIHPSSTTLFLLEELTGTRPEGVWVCGVVLPKGMCISRELQESQFHGRLAKEQRSDLGQFPFSWVLENGEYRTSLPLASVLDRMGRGDVYIKGANAIDPDGKVGVLYASEGAGTIGKVIAASRRKGFAILLPIGLEKVIPTPIAQAAKAASRERTDAAMGIPVGLIPVPGKAVTGHCRSHGKSRVPPCPRSFRRTVRPAAIPPVISGSPEGNENIRQGDPSVLPSAMAARKTGFCQE